jgi:hypothetical protein
MSKGRFVADVQKVRRQDAIKRNNHKFSRGTRTQRKLNLQMVLGYQEEGRRRQRACFVNRKEVKRRGIQCLRK